MEHAQDPFPSNIQIHNYDISTLFIETRGTVRLLFKKLSTNKGDVAGTYEDCIYLFSQLFDMVQDVIRRSGKVDDWEEKEKQYKSFIDRIGKGEFMPQQMVKMWEFLKEDIIKSGVYDENEESRIKTILKLVGG